MFSAVGYLIVEVSVCAVEGVVWLENAIVEPHCSVGDEEFSVQVVRYSSSILHFCYHVLDCFPRIGDVQGSALCQVLVDVHEGSFKISIVEFIRDTEP